MNVRGTDGNDILNAGDQKTSGAIAGLGGDTDSLRLDGRQGRYRISKNQGRGYTIEDTRNNTTFDVSGIEYLRFGSGEGDRMKIRDAVNA